MNPHLIINFFLYVCFSAGPFLLRFGPAFFLKTSWLFLLLLHGYFFINWVIKGINPKMFVLSYFLIAIISWLVEWIGVHTGIFFGDYSYGSSLGPAISGVPLIIGLNWTGLIHAIYVITKRYCSFRWIPVTGGLGCTLLDFFMEPIAPRWGFWKFDNGMPGIWNYACWYLFSVLFLILSGVMIKESDTEPLNLSALNLYICIILFYGASYVALNI